MSLRITTLVTLLLACITACAQTPWVELAKHRYDIEVADQENERQRGLMFRDEMPANHGMLFIHEYEEPLAYWMKNTRIPLDILYFDRNLKLVAQQRDVPPCTAGNACPAYPSNVPAMFVLELNAGQSAKIGLNTGDALQVAPSIELKAR